MFLARPRARAGLLPLLLLLASGGGSVRGAARSCLSQHALSTLDAFGVSVITVPDGPSVVALDKRVCATASPAVWIRYRGERMNLLNLTASDAQCHAVYSSFVCPAQYAYASDAAGAACHHANLIAYAAMQRMPACQSEWDCQQAPPELELGLIYCPWATRIRAAVCPGAAPAACSAVRVESFALDGDKACALTNSLCSSLVQNTILIASLAGLGYFMLLCTVIFCCIQYEQEDAPPCVVVYSEHADAAASRASRSLFGAR